MNVLFRGKRVDSAELVEGFYVRIQRDDSSYLYVIKLDTTLHISNVTRTTFEVIPETIEINLFGEWIKLLDLENYRLVKK